MQTFGSIIPGGPTLARLVPGLAAAGRQEVSLTAAGRRRLRVVRWYEEQGRNVTLTARHFHYSRSTVHVWLKRYKASGMKGLEDRSKRPKRVRQPSWDSGLEARVLELRNENPTWGKDKLTPILKREGIAVSVSMVGRILTRARRQGRLPPASLKDPCIVSRPQTRPYATRKPKDYLALAPGDLVQVDTADVRWTASDRYKHFSGRDYVSRWDVLDVHTRATARSAADFLKVLRQRMPFAVRAIQVDGGSEFKAEFEEACREQGLLLFVLPPRSPKLNGRVERAQRTHKEEFYQQVSPPDSLAELRAQLLDQEQRYNTYRPHQALGQKTPQQWLQDYAERR